MSIEVSNYVAVMKQALEALERYVAVMKQALEALDRCGSESYMLEREAITALRQAIAEAEDPNKATTKLLDGVEAVIKWVEAKLKEKNI